jgi:hypothetical protein
LSDLAAENDQSVCIGKPRAVQTVTHARLRRKTESRRARQIS